MGPWQDTDNSISDILEIFRSLRQEDRPGREEGEGKAKQYSTFSFDSKLVFNHEEPTPHSIPSKDSRFYSSIRSPLSTTRQNRPNKSREGKSPIFLKLYKENSQLKERRQQLFQEGKRQKLMEQAKECTFKPQTLRPQGVACRCTEGESEHFYQRHIEWKSRVDQAVKIKQVESSKENLKQLTFSPHIRHQSIDQSRNRSSSKDSVVSKKGVGSYLARQQKARNAEELLKSRWTSLNGTALLNSTQPNFIF